MHKPSRRILHDRKGWRATGALATVLGCGALAATASAAAPSGPYQDCPVTLATFNSCFQATTTSGSLSVKGLTVPITGTTVLQGGWLLQSDQNTLTVLGASDGNTLSGPALPIPGGITGLQNVPPGFPSDLNNVYAEVQLAGPDTPGQATEASFFIDGLLLGSGTTATIPVKIKLDNPFLGNSCYIGSDSDPITLNLTTGTTSPPAPNEPITGSPGTVSLDATEPVGDQSVAATTATGTSLVDNAFAVPVAHGCGYFPFRPLVDTAVDVRLGLPSAAGNNTAILNGGLSFAAASDVLNAENNQ